MKVTVRVVRLRIGSSGYEAVDITENVREVVKGLGLINGVVVTHTPSKYCLVTMIEYEPELLADLEEFMSKCGSVSGLAEALVGKSVVAPVVNNDLALGTFKRLVFIDLSRSKGEKEVVVALEGTFK